MTISIKVKTITILTVDVSNENAQVAEKDNFEEKLK